MGAGVNSYHNKEIDTPGPEQETIPFQLGGRIKLRTVGDNGLTTQTTVVGILDQIAILVEDPVFDNDDRISGRVGGEIYCVYFHEGYLYKFRSRFGQVLINDIVCMDYPKFFEAKQLRKHPRIRVNLETESVIGDERRLINGDIKDISKGGCCLELPGLFPLTAGTPVGLTFQLPNEELIQDLECTVMNMCSSESGKKTFVGLGFIGPKPEIAKINRFCEMCMYFRV